MFEKMFFLTCNATTIEQRLKGISEIFRANKGTLSAQQMALIEKSVTDRLNVYTL